MDWKLIGTTFVAVFIAELGDKTQLATLSFAAGGSSRLSVFIGSATALVMSSLVAVLAGESLTRIVAPATLQRLAGLLFVVIGVFVLCSTRSR